MQNESILDHPTLNSRMFYPWPNRFQDPFFIDGEAGRLGCWINKDFPDGLTMIHFHGNGETVADYIEDFSERIDELGVNLLLAEYRGYGMSQGEPQMAAMLADIPVIVKTIVEDCGVDPSRLVFFGRSLGSIYAIHAASLYPQAAGLVLESGIADPLERILVRVDPSELGTTHEALVAEAQRLFNHREKLAAFQGRTLVMHTRYDDLVSSTHGERLHAWAGEPKELVLFERGDHNSIMDVNREEYFDHLRDFFAKAAR